MIEFPPQYKVGITWSELEVVAGPDVVPTFKGYAPILIVRKTRTEQENTLYIAAKSICEQLEPLRAANNGDFKGLRFQIRKQSSDRFARYEVKPS